MTPTRWNLTPEQSAVLRTVEQASVEQASAIARDEIAKAAKLDESQVHEALKTLEDQGLVFSIGSSTIRGVLYAATITKKGN